ncbi:MAG TPA: tRNA (adenosine(37)-N6)-threonylcarbamoyltransferase complex ATPase subunit type 1 TsaE [Flavipsychrobacter sp.]|nr:tRNA (adenosine(37)-N6)-threonylcarbamoyltransferase complex ATPase subunit type 1 TsaE [Flavipsychrobacter sp.]
MTVPDVSFSISYTLDSIADAAAGFWQQARDFRVLAFEGDMGAGKTTFVHAVCDHLGVVDAVSSPTFALINEYHYTNERGEDQLIYHMDWYRINGEEEAIQAGMEDAVLDERAYCFVEWAEKARLLLPLPYLQVSVEAVSREERLLRCTAII